MTERETITTYNRRREDVPCDPIEECLDLEGFLRWVNSRDEFSGGGLLYATDAMLVGRVRDQNDAYRVYIVLYHLEQRTAHAGAFEFHGDVLHRFLYTCP